MSSLTKSGGSNFAMDTESFQRVVEFLPNDERPDIAPLLQERKSRYDNPRVTKLGGYRIPTPCNVDVIKWQHDNWNPSKDDVLIASFPKTGTTWLTAIVKNLIYNDDVEMMKLTKSITFLYSYLERGLPLKFEIMEKLPWKRKIWGTHLPAPLINMERLKKNGCKIIYITRNPKDQVVSWFKFCQKVPILKRMDGVSGKWEEFYEAFIAGKQPVFSKEGEWYPDHILSWYPYRYDDNVLFVTYEDIKQNTSTELKQICDFLGVKRSDEEISSIIKNTSFDHMKNATYGTQTMFYRKGEIGDWKNHFTVAQSELMDEKIRNKLSHTDIKFVFEN